MEKLKVLEFISYACGDCADHSYGKGYGDFYCDGLGSGTYDSAGYGDGSGYGEGYGSGYGILPYFEHGVGVSSFYKIFDNLGLKLTEVTDEFYRITKK